MSKITKAELQIHLAEALAEIEKLKREKDEMIAKKANADVKTLDNVRENIKKLQAVEDREHVQDLLDRGIEPREDHEDAWRKTFEGRWETAQEQGRGLEFYLQLFGLRPEDYEGGPVTLTGKLDPAPKWVARIAASAWREGGKEALNALAKDLLATNRVKIWWHKDHLEVSPKK